MAYFGSQPAAGFNPNGRVVWMGPTPEQDQAAAAAAEAQKQALADKLFKPVKRLTEGRADQLMHDPVQAQIRDYLSGVINGQNTPYSENVVNALEGQQAHGAATAQAAQMEALRQGLQASGGSIYDPGFQAAQRESDAARQGQNMDYAGMLRAQAALENFNAQNNAAKSLGALNQGQNAQINQLDLAGAGYRAGRFQEQQTGGVLMPQYNPMMQGGGGQSRQNEGQVDNKFAGPTPWTNFTASGTKPVQQMGQTAGSTPDTNANLYGPPEPQQAHFYGPMFSSPQTTQTAPQQQAVGGFTGPSATAVNPGDPLAILRGLMQQRNLA